MKKQIAHAQVVQLFHPTLHCGGCFTSLDTAVSRVFNNTTTPDACRHLWAVLSACVQVKGWNATKLKFEKLAGRYFPETHSPFIAETVRGLMSKFLVVEAA